MANSAQKLAEFLPYSTVYPDVVKRLDSFSRQAKNPDVVKGLLKKLKIKKGGCFIATASFETHSVEIYFLRRFRDQCLRQSILGRQLIYIYYKTSPTIACFLDRFPSVKPLVRSTLRGFLFFIKSKKIVE